MKKLIFALACIATLGNTGIALADKGGIPHWKNPSHPHYQQRNPNYYNYHHDWNKQRKQYREEYHYWPTSSYRERPDYRHDYRAPRNSYFDPIRDGVRYGRLSYREESDLRRRLNDLKYQEREYLRDGHLSWREREDMRRDRADFDKRLDHELRDGEYR